MHSDETELDLLEKIHNSPANLRQRDLARIIGLSLGMTNSILKRLAQKGWLKIQKINNRNIQYIVSPRGLEKIARRSYRYFRRTIKNVVDYKVAIEELIGEIVSLGYRRIILVGRSDLDFIVDHLCAKHHLGFERSVGKNGRLAQTAKGFLLYSEKMIAVPRLETGSDSLRRIATGKTLRRIPSLPS